MQWITENSELLTLGIVTLWTLVVTVIRLTPTKKDDAFLEKIMPFADRLKDVDVDKVLEVLAALPTKPEVERCPLACPHDDQCTLEKDHEGGCRHTGCDCNESNTSKDDDATVEL